MTSPNLSIGEELSPLGIIGGINEKSMSNKSENNHTKPHWNTADGNFYPHVKAIRDDLKKEMTNAEKILWQQIRNNKLGVKFRRQHIIDCYIPDFVSLSIKLIIEVDGKIHLKRKQEDLERTKILENHGYTLIRFWNEEIENDIEEVIKEITKSIEELLCK